MDFDNSYPPPPIEGCSIYTPITRPIRNPDEQALNVARFVQINPEAPSLTDDPYPF